MSNQNTTTIQFDDISENITLQFTHNGYDVEISISPESIKNRIDHTERTRKQEINNRGASAFRISQYANVRAEPTDEKWRELANIEPEPLD